MGIEASRLLEVVRRRYTPDTRPSPQSLTLNLQHEGWKPRFEKLSLERQASNS